MILSFLYPLLQFPYSPEFCSLSNRLFRSYNEVFPVTHCLASECLESSLKVLVPQVTLHCLVVYWFCKGLIRECHLESNFLFDVWVPLFWQGSYLCKTIKDVNRIIWRRPCSLFTLNPSIGKGKLLIGRSRVRSMARTRQLSKIWSLKSTRSIRCRQCHSWGCLWANWGVDLFGMFSFRDSCQYILCRQCYWKRLLHIPKY